MQAEHLFSSEKKPEAQPVHVALSVQLAQLARQASQEPVALLKNYPDIQVVLTHKVVFGSYQYPSEQTSQFVAFLHVSHPEVQLSHVFVALLKNV